MHRLPPRRWFQYYLSTWLVLVAILAWAMLEWPWVERRWESTGSGPGVIFNVMRKRMNPALLYPALGLLVVVGWKAVWALGRRAKQQQTHLIVEYGNDGRVTTDDFSTPGREGRR